MSFGLTPGKLGFKLNDVLMGLKSGTTDVPEAIVTNEGKAHVIQYQWNPDTLAFEVVTTNGAGIGQEVFVTNIEGADLSTRLDVVSSTITYVGKAQPGTATAAALWKITRLTSNAEGDLTLEYANGAAVYNQIWDNRAALSYS